MKLAVAVEHQIKQRCSETGNTCFTLYSCLLLKNSNELQKL